MVGALGRCCSKRSDFVTAGLLSLSTALNPRKLWKAGGGGKLDWDPSVGGRCSRMFGAPHGTEGPPSQALACLTLQQKAGQAGASLTGTEWEAGSAPRAAL